ncbi:MAG: hypothetical protein L3J73_03310, partial [Thermoplasmata archaeon]|nr:hypothetical protein [Thermoplasmata archaeon]
MPQYALIGTHPPSGCPMASKGAREAAMKAYESLEGLLKSHKAKLLLDLHLDPNHMAFMMFEAPTAEAVRDIVTDSGMVQFLDLSFHLITPIPELLKRA